MGLQLIFVVETDSKSKSDWMYIKNTIDFFYEYDKAHVRLSPVYMGGKGNYRKREKEVSNLIKQYAAASKTNETKVIYCFDCDDYDSIPADMDFLKNAKQYCERQGADFVWFCKDIERVYLDKKVENKQKKIEAAKFKQKKLITGIDIRKLEVTGYRNNTSNIMKILDKYLSRK